MSREGPPLDAPGDGSSAPAMVSPGPQPGLPRVSELEAQIAGLKAQVAALAETLDRERRASQAGLEEAATLRLVLDHVPAMVGFIDAEERCRLANRTTEDWLGRSRQGLNGRLAREILGPATYERIRGFIERALAGETVTYTRAVAYRAGEQRRIRASWVPARDENGTVTGVCIIIHDVTELAMAIEAVSESRELYRLIAETSPDFIFQLDTSGTVTYLSPASLTVLGIEPDKIVGSKFMRFFRPQEYPGVLAIFERVAAGERVGLIEFDALHRDGTVIPVEVSAAPITRDGVIVGVLGIARDIRERRRAQEGLRRYQERLEQLLEERAAQLQQAYSMFDTNLAERARVEEALTAKEERARAIANVAPVMLWASDPNGECTFLNDAWLAFRGRTLAEEEGSGWAAGVHPDDVASCLAAYAGAFAERRPFRSQYRLCRNDGEYRWVLDDAVPRFHGDGAFAGYLGCCIDVTDLKQTS